MRDFLSGRLPPGMGLLSMNALDRLRDLFQPSAGREPEGGREQGIRMAACLLLVEMEHADYHRDKAERGAAKAQLRQHFGLDDASAEALLAEAEERDREAVSMHRYLSTLNEFLEYKDKLAVLEMLWQVAYADGSLHRYEEALVRRIAELLYVEHQDFIHTKLAVQKALGLQ
jgi:uncharacterized tellurite resistance protein B-like protein